MTSFPTWGTLKFSSIAVRYHHSRAFYFTKLGVLDLFHGACHGVRSVDDHLQGGVFPGANYLGCSMQSGTWADGVDILRQYMS